MLKFVSVIDFTKRMINMIEETRTYWCDACGRKINGYVGSIDVIEFNEDGYAESVGRDFCKDCMSSFQKWLKERRATNPEKSYID